MEAEFWHQRWRDGAIPFHRTTVNPHLVAHIERLGLRRGDCVFVPLCGKSVDLRWLHERGQAVLGVELSTVAVESFFVESGYPYRRSRCGRLECYQHGTLRLLCGDFFDLPSAELSAVRGVFDRAALIALPERLRARYAARLSALLPPGVPVLLVTLEYSQAEMDGPPFSVPESEVRAHFESAFQVECLHAADVLEDSPRFKERGLSKLAEKVYCLSPLPRSAPGSGRGA